MRIVNTSQRADWRTPWNPGRIGRATGSGFIIEGGRILTNAHVVADTKNLVFYLHGDANPHEARIVFLGHDCDLALVEPVEPKLLADRAALQFGDTPKIGEEVLTLGYPAGGRWMSSTRGVVSRIDVTASMHSGGSAHLSIQTDAAINPGNSGGPVLGDGKVVGVAFQGIGSLENTGFFIPPAIIQHFLTDIADGHYDGFPQLDVFVSSLDAPAARKRAGMTDTQTGVRVDFVHPASPSLGVLKEGDILLSLDGETIANDGTYDYQGQQLQIQAIIDRFTPGQSLPAQVLRDGKVQSIPIPLGRGVYPGRAYETLPKYLVYGGLVFVPMDREYVDTFGGGPDADILYAWSYQQLEVPDRALPGHVVLLRRLDHAVNAQFSMSGNVVVDKINGVEIHTLQDVVTALGQNQGVHHVFEFNMVDRIGVLDRAAADAAQAEILKQYGVPADRRL